MDKAIRNTLRNVVTQCRRLLEAAIGESLQGQFGIHRDGTVEPDGRMTHLSAEDRAYRGQVLAHLRHIEASGLKPTDAVSQLVREVAFTHLNRLCAYKLLEQRKLIREAVSRGMNSNGFKFYLADHPEDERRWSGGQQEIAYRHFLLWLGSTLSDEIGVLFSPHDPANRLFPRQLVLDQVLTLINSAELVSVWNEDETIGWVYQYFTPPELRDQARKDSPAPRNSYELSFRNQFYTPRYVVQFLVDNTLGRTWYEMRRGDTALREQCQYLVWRPHEVFLSQGECVPDNEQQNGQDGQASASNQSVYVAYRTKRDPRSLRILDPACGSGHFLLYCFDVLQTIYEEAYADDELGSTLQADYPTLDDLRTALPGLILRYNLHGIDIDLRATQIASLALWLRAQRAYGEFGIKGATRPKITRSNIIHAEPMPGERELLEEFVQQLQPPVLGQLLCEIFDKMQLAGEAGSLLKIDAEIRSALADARQHWQRQYMREQDRYGNEMLFSRAEMDGLSRRIAEQGVVWNVSEITDEEFWQQAEEYVLDALREFAQRAAHGDEYRRALFADDAAHGFAFIDVSRKIFDVVLMNPPFGLPTGKVYRYLVKAYPTAYSDLAATFMALIDKFCAPGGYLGAITTRTYLQSADLPEFRKLQVLPNIEYIVDLGSGVMDEAWVDTSVQIFTTGNRHDDFIVVDRRRLPDSLKELPINLEEPQPNEQVYITSRTQFEDVPKYRLAYDAGNELSTLIASPSRLSPNIILSATGLTTFDDERFYRLRWEVSSTSVGPSKTWCYVVKNTPFAAYYHPYHVLVKWADNGAELSEKNKEVNGQTAQARQGSKNYFKPGVAFSRRSEPTFTVKVHPAGCAFSSNGAVILPKTSISLYYLCGLLNSTPFRAAVRLLANKYLYTSGHVESLAWKQPSATQEDMIHKAAELAIKAKLELEIANETDPYYVGFPTVDHTTSLDHLAQRESTKRQALATIIVDQSEGIDQVVHDLYNLTISKAMLAANYRADPKDLSRASTIAAIGARELSEDLLSYTVGCAFGRWDVRFATGERAFPDLPDPFAPLPVYAPGALTPESDRTGYSLTIDDDGILVDDLDHPEDIARRVHDVLELLWGAQADAIEQEVCTLLGVKDVRDYLRKGFFDEHIRRYSKSRRKAPIYWLLQSPKRSYGLWLYYHLLDADMLFKALIHYVEPKLRLEQDRLDALRQQRQQFGSSGKEARQAEKALAQQEAIVADVQEFRDRLDRAARHYLMPDFNDGVILTIAPLWELVPWKEAKTYWNELLAGKYEWSSIGKQLRQKGLVK